MKDFVIFTDSGCDIKPHKLAEWGVKSVSLTFRFEDENKEYSNEDMDILSFYNRMREGGVAKTSAINPEAFSAAFEEALRDGKDVLYVGFSSGLSTTCNSGRIAAEELMEQYPERRVVVVDTLSASAGLGLAVYFAAEMQKDGASMDEIAAYIDGIKGNIAHWVTVDDLEYLKRGGRVSPTVAFVGKALGIKPIIHVTDDGKLDSVSKARGRKAAVKALCDKYGESAMDKKGGVVFISHADCQEDADALAAMLLEEYGVQVKVITDIGTVIGAHAGPGTLALFFVAAER